jgi:hypothetical protein
MTVCNMASNELALLPRRELTDWSRAMSAYWPDMMLVVMGKSMMFESEIYRALRGGRLRYPRYEWLEDDMLGPSCNGDGKERNGQCLKNNADVNPRSVAAVVLHSLNTVPTPCDNDACQVFDRVACCRA